MRVLIIYPDICIAAGRFQEGIGYIASLLKEGGHTPYLMHLEKEPSEKEFIRKVSSIAPDLIGFSATTNQYPYVKKLSKWIKGYSDIPVICGGIHPTLSPEEVIAEDSIDVLCIGEGEYPMLELANKMVTGDDISNIRNLWVKQNGHVIKNPLRPLIENLDDLPFPDRDLFNYKDMLKKFAGRAEGLYIAEIMTGRGCPFECTYCCNHALRKTYEGLGNYVRRRSVDNVMAEIEQLVNEYDINWLVFDDDTFTIHPKWIEEFCEKYRNKFSITFQCNAFPTTLKPNIVRMLKEAGCSRVTVGIESGNEWLRQEVLKRPITNDQLIASFKLLSEYGIEGYSFNMVGFPYETAEMLEDTCNLNRLLNPNHIQVSIFYPYPGTELYKTCLNNGWLSENGKSSYFAEGTVLNLPNLTEDQINRYFRKLHSLSIDKIVRSSYPNIYWFYNFSKRILGESINYRMSILARRLLYHY